MISFLTWVVTELDNTTSEVQRDQKSESWSKFSFAFHIFLPLAGLFILFKQKQIFSRLLLQLDRDCVSVFCPSFSHREKLLKWAGSRLPETWSSQSKTLAGGVAELWSDGSLLCTLINSAIPGACPNPHRHWKKPPLHAQAIAYKYLGVIPIFTENELASKLTISLERSFLRYLNELQEAVIKLSEKNDVPKSISIHYITRGMGLYTGEQHRKTVFYVYPNMNTVGQNSNIIVHIRGPYATYGKAIIPKFQKDLFPTPEISVTSDLLATTKLLNGHLTKPKNSFIRNFSLPFMQYHKKHLGDNIIIDVAMEGDRAKVTYIPKNYGMYEIIMISNGELVRGCPFNVHILNNVSGIEDSFDSEEKIDDIPNLRRRKILSKTIDFIDEQMPVSDVLSRYKIKEEHIKITHHIELKENIKLTRDEKNDMDITKQQVATPDLTEEEELYSLENNINSDTDKSDVNLDIPGNIIGRVIEKQNSESTNENSKLSASNGNNLIVGHILGKNNQTHLVHKVNYYADNRSTHKVVNNDVSEGLQLKSATVSTSDDKNTADVLDQQQAVQDYVCNINSTKPTFHSSPRKLKIPEKFCELQNTRNGSFNNGLHTKYFKDVINTSNKNEVQSNQFQKKEIVYTQIRHLQNFSDKNDYTDGDDNNNYQTPSLNQSNQNIICFNTKVDVEKLKDIPKRFLQNQKPSQNLEPSLVTPKNTSPICPHHIVPEVVNEYTKMSVAEKRKIFAKQIPNRISSSTNSSFSGSENGEVSPNRINFKHFEGLSVLNYLGSLKKSEYKKNLENYPLCNTVSLPNISSMESEIFQNSVKQRTSFWEKISSSSSSLSINSEMPLQKKPSKRADMERCKLIWKRPDETTTSDTSISTIENTNVDKGAETRKSADDILSVSNYIPQETPKKYKSMDHSLDKCTAMSIEERKRLLLKQNYEKESPKTLSAVPIKNGSVKENRMKLIQEKQDLNSDDEKENGSVKENLTKLIEEKRNPNNEDKKNNGRVKENRTKFIQEKQDLNNEDEKDIVVFSSILDRIKKYDKACNLSNKIEEEPSNKNINDVTAACFPRKQPSPNTTTVCRNENSHKLPKIEVLTFKSHFKRAIKYFKNLEEKSLNKSRVNTLLKNRRRYSLDNSPNRRKNNSRKGGSLNLPNVSQRFSVNNLYEDVFGNRKSIFKGAANRSALVDALATFSRNETVNLADDEDEIIYEIFRKRAKTKRRKNVKSIFDLYY